MKNKMKLWRKEAQVHNETAGRKHQGRRNKSANVKWRKSVLMNDMLKALFARVGMSAADIAVRDKIAELEGRDVLSQLKAS